MSSEVLASLAQTESLLVKQQFEGLEAFANAAGNALGMGALSSLGETANKYDVHAVEPNNTGGGHAPVKFRIIEQSEYCGLTGRCCCRPNHKLQLHVFMPEKDHDHAVMVFDRPCKCGSCCAITDICRQEMSVHEGSSADGPSIGWVKQPMLGGGLSPQLELMDREGGEPVATITANAVCCIGGLCCDHTFVVKDAKSGQELGKLIKQKPDSMGQLATELMGDADIFTMQVNGDVSVQRKATLLAALHLIDYMFFEDEGEVQLDFVNGKCAFKCCDMYCLGCKMPCKCECGGGGGGKE